MNKVSSFLAKPFPQEESIVDTLKIVAAISIFVFLFLYIFKPFGLHLLESGQFLLCLGFGIVAFLASMVYEFLIVKILKLKGPEANFTFGRWIMYFLGAMLFISLANFLFVRIVLFDHIQWSLFPYMVRGTFAIGVFPIIVLGALALLAQERKYQNIATEVNQKDSYSKASELSNYTIYDIPSDQIRYIESMQNYINIGYLDSDHQFKEQSERATLSSTLSDLELTPREHTILRCHRSFLVNKGFISGVSGNAQGLLLSLEGCQKKIPVSRRYVPIFRAL